MTAPTIIIGGGAIGSSIAYFLSRISSSPHSIVVIERDPAYRVASTSLSVSSLRQQFSTAVNIRLSQFGYEFMQSCAERDRPGGAVEFVPCGYLFIGRPDQEAVLRARAALARSLGVVVRDYLAADLARSFPWMNCADLSFGTQALVGEGWFDGYKLMQWYRGRARAAGVRYVRATVAAVEFDGTSAIGVRLDDGVGIAANQVVIAAGAWSGSIASSLGTFLPVKARRRTVFVLSCPVTMPHFPILIDVSGIYVRPDNSHFLCIVSPSPADDRDGLPLEPELDLFENFIWPNLAQRIPPFEALRVVRAWAGYYEFNPVDRNGIVGHWGADNFFVATGFSGHGLMHSAGVGRAMAELMIYGEYRSIDLSELSPLRLSQQRGCPEDAIY